MSYSIVPYYGHYQVYINGHFFCSADTMSEAVKEVENFCR